jgi:hypothetical protein
MDKDQVVYRPIVLHCFDRALAWGIDDDLLQIETRVSSISYVLLRKRNKS